MERLERQILIKGRKVLEDSLKTNWSEGYLDDWTAWALKMKQSIRAFLEITEPLVEDEQINIEQRTFFNGMPEDNLPDLPKTPETK